MEYVIIARLDLSDAPEIRAMLESDTALKRIESNGSKRRPLTVEQEMTDIYIIKVWFNNRNKTIKLFNDVKNYMNTNNIYGIVHWHNCNHDTNVGQCVIQEVYTRKPEGVNE